MTRWDHLARGFLALCLLAIVGGAIAVISWDRMSWRPVPAGHLRFVRVGQVQGCPQPQPSACCYQGKFTSCQDQITCQPAPYPSCTASNLLGGCTSPSCSPPPNNPNYVYQYSGQKCIFALYSIKTDLCQIDGFEDCTLPDSSTGRICSYTYVPKTDPAAPSTNICNCSTTSGNLCQSGQPATPCPTQ